MKVASHRKTRLSFGPVFNHLHVWRLQDAGVHGKWRHASSLQSLSRTDTKGALHLILHCLGSHRGWEGGRNCSVALHKVERNFWGSAINVSPLPCRDTGPGLTLCHGAINVSPLPCRDTGPGLTLCHGATVCRGRSILSERSAMALVDLLFCSLPFALGPSHRHRFGMSSLKINTEFRICAVARSL